jgi:hypothetical protein
MKKRNSLHRQKMASVGAALTAAHFLSTGDAKAATPVLQDFENVKTSDFSQITGQGLESSKLEVSMEKAHSGRQSLKLTYQSAGGYLQFTPVKGPRLDLAGNKLEVAMWVYGSGKRDFSSAALRILDKNNESFQFDIPGLAEAMSGEGWREVRAIIDISKIGGHWGDNVDGVIDAPFVFFGLAASRASNAPTSGTVYIDDMQFGDPPGVDLTGAAAPAAVPVVPVAAVAGATVPVLSIEPVTAAVTGPEAPVLKWVFAPGQPALFRAKLALQNSAQGQSLVWKVRDAFDNVLAQGKEKVADGGLERSVDFRIAKPPMGMLYVTGTLLNAKEEIVAEGRTRAAVFTPRRKPISLQPYIWGVAAHLGRDNAKNAPSEIALMRMLGFASSRSDMTWNNIQPTPGVWNWETTDKIYDLFEREGITPAPVLSYGTKWATTGDANSSDWHQWNNTPPRNEDFAKYAAAAVKRYGHLTRYWEIWNEPDIDFWLGTVEQYTALVDATVPAIKAVQPEAQIMNGGFSEVRRRPDFIPTYLKTVRNRPDIFAVHTHGHFENLLRAETTVNDYLAGAGLTGTNKPQVWLNEAGFSNARGASETEQAMQLVKKMSYSPAAGFMGYTWYDLRDDGTDPNENEHNFGLVRQDFSPKASALAANTFLNTIGERKFSGRLPVGKAGYALLYRGQGTTALSAWRQSYTKGAAVVPLVLRAKSQTGAPLKLERRDIFGNTAPVQVRDGLFFLSLGNVPQYIVASGENVQFELARDNGMLLDFPPSVVATPGEALALPVKIANPFTVPLKGSLSIEGAAPVNVDVAPLSTKDYPVTVARSGKSGAKESLKVSLKSEQIPSVLDGVIEIQTAYVIPQAPASLDVTIPRSNIVSLFEATPMQELHFKDDSDMSVKVHLQKTAQGTKVRLDVTDQTQFVEAAAGNWWRGDSVQWAIGLPGGEMWEWMGTLLPTGPKMLVSMTPDGKTGAEAPIDIRRQGTQTIYEWTIPSTLPGGKPLPDRFNFTFLVNDNDGGGRKGWMEWTPGIGMEKNPTTFVPLAIQK